MSIRTNLVAASLVVLVSAAPALAADHLMKVGEVMLANAGGSTAVQFIELEDPGAEGFPSTPYVLEVYSAAGGTALNTYAMTLPSGTMRYVAATAQAQADFGFTAQTTLTATLPASGQACFRRNGGTPANIHCFAWGTITGIVPGNSMNNGTSPANGMSVQRVSNTYVVATPTPNAANSAGTVDMPMVDGPPATDAGVDAPGATPDAPGGNPVTPGDDEDGCSVGSGASWLGLAMLALLLLVRRSSTQRKR